MAEFSPFCQHSLAIPTFLCNFVSTKQWTGLSLACNAGERKVRATQDNLLPNEKRSARVRLTQKKTTACG